MAIKVGSLPLILFPLLSLSLISPTNAGGIAVYWGEKANVSTLTETCNSGLYEIVIIAFLHKFGNNQQPEISLTDYCDPSPNSCQRVGTDIHNCQNRGVKVMLSIGGGDDNTYSLSSADEARGLATYIWNNFLAGQSSSRPFGDAILDGVDFDIETGDGQYYADLAGKLLELSGGRKLYLTAAPQCSFPDQYLEVALSTGLFDYVWIQFYNNEACQFNSGNPSGFQNSWNQWSSSIKATRFYVGLPASPTAASGGYVQSEQLINQVLPFVKKSANYGGIMLWDRYNDVGNRYSSQVKNNV